MDEPAAEDEMSTDAHGPTRLGPVQDVGAGNSSLPVMRPGLSTVNETLRLGALY